MWINSPGVIRFPQCPIYNQVKFWRDVPLVRFGLSLVWSVLWSRVGIKTDDFYILQSKMVRYTLYWSFQKYDSNLMLPLFLCSSSKIIINCNVFALTTFLNAPSQAVYCWLKELFQKSLQFLFWNPPTHHTYLSFFAVPLNIKEGFIIGTYSFI